MVKGKVCEDEFAYLCIYRDGIAHTNCLRHSVMTWPLTNEHETEKIDSQDHLGPLWNILDCFGPFGLLCIASDLFAPIHTVIVHN